MKERKEGYREGGEKTEKERTAFTQSEMIGSEGERKRDSEMLMKGAEEDLTQCEPTHTCSCYSHKQSIQIVRSDKTTVEPAFTPFNFTHPYILKQR